MAASTTINVAPPVDESHRTGLGMIEVNSQQGQNANELSRLLPAADKPAASSAPSAETAPKSESKVRDAHTIEKDKHGPGIIWRSIDYYPDYDWTKRFDMVLLCFMAVWFVIMLALTYYVHNDMYREPGKYTMFWVYQLGKLTFMVLVAFVGGLIVDWYNVKVNYTRKIQHFCAYLIPLASTGHDHSSNNWSSDLGDQLILEWWGYWFTLMSFAIFVYPIRNNIRFIDICYCSLDRPEDRPNTLYWICTQVFLGYCILSTFKWYCDYTGQTTLKALVFIPVFTTGIGDGMAEPVGVAWGRHKYRTRGFCDEHEYTRSYEGSACVFLTCVLTIAFLYYQFENWMQFWLTMAFCPIIMTLAEAFSPHTWDTPFLMLAGCGVLWCVTFVH